MRLKTTVGQVAWVGGSRYDRPGGVLVDERASHFARGRSRGNLYALVEVSGPAAGRDIIADQLAQDIRAVYYDWRGSVTAGLQQALYQVNLLLFDENRNSLPTERRTAGVSCAVLRGDDLFIAQAGPAAIYVAHGGETTRFPDVSPWLDDTPLEEMHAVPLGERRDVNVTLFHTQVSSGDTILLVDGGLARRASPQVWPPLLARSTVAAVLDELLTVGEGGDLSAVVVRLADEGTAQAPSQPIAPSGAPEAPEAVAPPARKQPPAWLGPLRPGGRLRTAGQALVAALGGLWAALLTLLKRMMPGQLGPPQTRRRRTTPVKKAEAKPRKRRKRRATGEGRGDLAQKILIGVAIAIPIVVAVVVLWTVVRRGQTQRAKLRTLQQQAHALWEQAQTTSDEAAVRTLMTQAADLLDQYLEHRPDDAETVELRKRIEARLDEINRVRRITWVGALNTYPADANLSRVVVEGAHVFVMDRNGGRVYHHQLDELRQALQPDTQGTVLVRKGQQVGDVLVGDLVDMVWMPVGHGRQKASLVILESGGALLEYDPTTEELLSLRVAAVETWQYPDLVGSHSGRFYVLDSQANQIWRYTPTADGYSEPPEEWLQTQVDLVGAVDMAIGDSIYLLYADGRIRKLSQGAPDAFDISDWDTPPRNPAALFTRPPESTQSVYVADRGNDRIVQCGKGGQFERQFRLADAQAAENGEALANVSSLFVDEISGHAYFLSGRKLYLIILPD